MKCQIRRTAVSGLNIVEEKNRWSKKEFRRFLYISKGSCEEVHYLLFLAGGLKYMDVALCDNAQDKCGEIRKMLNGLIESLTDIVKN